MNGRRKLEALGINLPLLPTTAVGSYPKPVELTRARTAHARGEIDHAELRRLEQEATAMWMGFQNEIGVDVPVDGEMYRGDMVAFFAEEMDGFERGGLVRSYGNRFYRKPIITSEIGWKQPMTVDWWRYAQSLTEAPVKGMLTGGYTVMDWSFNEHYPDRREAALAFSRELRKEVEALIEAGCRIIQIDEPALSVRAGELDVAIECMRVTTEGLDAYFLTHACFGAFETVFPGMLEMPVDNFDLEMANSGFDLVETFHRHGFGKDLSFGVVDIHSHVVETAEQVAERVRMALQSMPAENLWVDPDCGLKTRTVEEAQAKMRAIVQGTREVRTELSAVAR
ncbi:MAG TPA: methionine synthase [Actinomycetota bacterium]|nr:methionine synthase [Actinomycetota bacterium]